MRVNVLTALTTLANLNTSILGFFTDEVPLISGYGTSRDYMEPVSVAAHFGSNSATYRMAVMMFAQNINLKSGKGYLTIIPQSQSVAAQPATILGSNVVDFTKLTATNYFLRVSTNGGAQTDVSIGTIDSTTLDSIVSSLNSTAITAKGLVFSVSGEITSAKVTLQTIATGLTASIDVNTPSTAPTNETDISSLIGITGSATGAGAGVERVKDAILRTVNSVNYFGIILNKKLSDADQLEVSTLVQGLDKIMFISSSLSADIIGIFKDIKNASLTHTRCLYYSASGNKALDFAAGYSSRGLCVNMDGANTALTMNLKDIAGIVADDIDQTTLNLCKSNGVDIYANFGVPKVITSGANGWFDAIYFQLAFKVQLQIASFNYLASTNTKIPQTETGMNGLKSAWRKVCDKFITNGFGAPGAWTDPTTFGDPEDHIRNVADFGYYIYTLPVAQQDPNERKARIAPMGNIAIKSSGAIHGGDLNIFIEA
jgi:hypothetical protein